MKNIIIASALAVGGGAYATSPQTIFFHDGIMDTIFQEDFIPMSLTDLPIAVIDSITKDYGIDNVDAVYKNDLNEYKLDLNINDQIETVYKDENGHWIKK
ncbi:conserved hypothetical protein (DUF2874) [Formosa agariphila KMM 3901]|uniref:Uncharacterized protein n=1 Tax=Formosa agariphila (strain DSM 15362 / KCTC 12365 / LMG 23005 / KMM 3901 / M-2Alg 35-1) TaxID=1347342 RepID=T2KJF9_FORAG|nr:hypothetical protein [Formosa agariphila]CDF79027.1 conserved hypothetical protein (DUF2874) [Formosa agariphila KMM 3901]